jgi:hypothetical protein
LRNHISYSVFSKRATRWKNEGSWSRVVYFPQSMPQAENITNLSRGQSRQLFSGPTRALAPQGRRERSRCNRVGSSSREETASGKPPAKSVSFVLLRKYQREYQPLFTAPCFCIADSRSIPNGKRRNTNLDLEFLLGERVPVMSQYALSPPERRTTGFSNLRKDETKTITSAHMLLVTCELSC